MATSVLADYAAAASQNHDRVISVTAGQYITVHAGSTGTSAQTGAPTVSVIAGSGLTLGLIGRRAPGVNTSCMAAVYGGFATATGNVTIRVAFSSAPADAFTYILADTNIDTSTPFYGVTPDSSASNGATATTPSLVLSAAPASADIVRGLFVMRNKTAAATPGSGFASRKNGFHAAPCAGLLLEEATGRTSTSVPASNMGTVYNAGVGYVLKTIPAPSLPANVFWDSATETFKQVEPLYWDADAQTFRPLEVLYWDSSANAFRQ